MDVGLCPACGSNLNFANHIPSCPMIEVLPAESFNKAKDSTPPQLAEALAIVGQYVMSIIEQRGLQALRVTMFSDENAKNFEGITGEELEALEGQWSAGILVGSTMTQQFFSENGLLDKERFNIFCVDMINKFG